jgi:class 3 adenylate cyclase
MTMPVDARALDERLGRLEAARGWSPRVVSRLEALIRGGEDRALFRVNPFVLAAEREVEPGEAVDLLLHATVAGLFEMDWLLICPRCACAVQSFTRLRAVERRYRCPECQSDYEAAMDDLIAVYFTVSPQIRAIRYHRPETLEAFDYLYHFRGVAEGRMPDGQPFIEATRGVLRGVDFLEPGKPGRFAFAATPGIISGFSADRLAGFSFHVREAQGSEVNGAPAQGVQRLALRWDADGFEPGEAVLAPGPVELEALNATGQRAVLAVMQLPPGYEDELLRFDPYLTGKHLLTSQTFKSLFRSEVVGGAQGLAIRDIALLFTDIKSSTALYQRIGDLNAFQLVQQHFDWLREATVRHQGVVVKTIGDAVMAVYPDAALATAAALDMRGTVERFRWQQPERAVSLKIGIHHGAAIAVTLNDGLDYFGQTVNIASRVQEMADADEICITGEVGSYPGVEALLATYQAERLTAELQGVGGSMPIIKIGGRAHTPAPA